MDAMIKAFANQVANDGRAKIRKAMRIVAGRAQADFIQQGQACIDNYYAEFSPVVYHRTGNLQNNVINPYKRYRRNEIDIGVSFDSNNMGSYKSNDALAEYKEKPYLKNTAQLVVENAMGGIHGNPSVYVGANIDRTMMHFTSAYAHLFLDGYFRAVISSL